MSGQTTPTITAKLRTAIYARFSTDLQNERSIEDQAALCRSFAAREGLEVVQVFEDRARSGGSILGRDGLLALLDGARNGSFQIVLIEALDRLSRDMEDLASLYKRLTFLGIEIRAVHEGVVNTVLVGLRGLVGQLYREDNAHKIRRASAGRVAQGLVPAGLTYGYAIVPGEQGKRRIEAQEAEVVRRIFEEFVAGLTPREIAHGLNRDRVRAPRGRQWNASTLNGNPQRKTGILHNEIYCGRLVWNRVRMIKDPDTGRRVSRVNAERDWHRVDVPELAIVSPELFEAAKARKQSRSIGFPTYHRKPKHMLSGLLRCGACGSGMAVNGGDRTGRLRLRCCGAIESGTCPDPKTFYLHKVEEAVLTGLQTELRHPKAIAEYVRTYQMERERLSAHAVAERVRIENRLAAIERESEKITDYLINDVGDVTRLDQRAKALKAEEDELQRQLAATAKMPECASLHPAILARYDEQLARLRETLENGINAGDSEIAAALRDLVDKVTVFRDPTRLGGVSVEIAGRLNALILNDNLPPHSTRVCGELVAAG
jgi:site-specific DNA recombinase